MLLASSRQVFAFSRDGALPFSRILYRMNSYTRTPVNTVWFSAICAALMGLLVFAGDQAINAVFSTGVTAAYIAYMVPIVARFAFKNDFKPGPFSLGWFVSMLLTLFLCRSYFLTHGVIYRACHVLSSLFSGWHLYSLYLCSQKIRSLENPLPRRI